VNAAGYSGKCRVNVVVLVPVTGQDGLADHAFDDTLAVSEAMQVHQIAALDAPFSSIRGDQEVPHLYIVGWSAPP
jgi:hypothetical protein